MHCCVVYYSTQNVRTLRQFLESFVVVKKADEFPGASFNTAPTERGKERTKERKKERKE